MKKEPFDINPANNKDQKTKQDVIIRNLAGLLKEKKLANDIVEREVRNLDIKLYDLCYKIIAEAGLMDDFLDYFSKNEMRKAIVSIDDEERLLVGFLKRIQTEFEKTEQEITAPEKVEIPEPVVPPQPEQVQPAEPAKPEEIEVAPKPEMKNWWEVKRETEVMAVEDLSGSMGTFEEHVQKLGVAKKDSAGRWQWTGGNKKLVFLGDILGDRDMDGLQIISNIGRLSGEAEKQGGQIDVLCGNHEMEFISFLSRAGGDNWAKINANHFTSQSIGIWELSRFDPDPNSELKKISPQIRVGRNKGEKNEKFEKKEKELWDKLYKKMPEILENMRTDPEGRKILESICKIKVAAVYDDTLFCHTDPTRSMMTDLGKEGDISRRVVEINENFQRNLRGILLNGGQPDAELWQMEKIYISANSRKYFTETERGDPMGEELLARVAERLHQDGKIELSLVGEKRFKNLGMQPDNQWYYCAYQLVNELKKIEVDEVAIATYVENWQRENGVAGNWTKPVVEIFRRVENMKGDVNLLYSSAESLNQEIESSNSLEEIVARVRQLGINTIVHGHSPDQFGRYFEGNGLLIVSPHAKYSSSGKGIFEVKKNGRIELTGKTFRSGK